MAAAERFRPSYRYLAAVLHAMGRDVDQELAGSDRPESAEKLLNDHANWLD